MYLACMTCVDNKQCSKKKIQWKISNHKQRNHGPLHELEIGPEAIKEWWYCADRSHPLCVLCHNRKKHRQFGDHVWSNKNDEKRQSKCDQVEDPACTWTIDFQILRSIENTATYVFEINGKILSFYLKSCGSLLEKKNYFNMLIVSSQGFSQNP